MFFVVNRRSGWSSVVGGCPVSKPRDFIDRSPTHALIRSADVRHLLILLGRYRLHVRQLCVVADDLDLVPRADRYDSLALIDGTIASTDGTMNVIAGSTVTNVRAKRRQRRLPLHQWRIFLRQHAFRTKAMKLVGELPRNNLVRAEG